MRIFIIILVFTTIAACKEKYDLPYSGPALGYLVVDGTINSGQGPTTIRLSRTLGLVDTVPVRNEVDAGVWVEGENNTQFFLNEIEDGIYTNPQLNLQPNVKYRLRIQTTDGKEYFSAFTNTKKTPPIDDITWERINTGVQFYINTHDLQNATRYYRWEYDETWEIHSAYVSTLKYLYNGNGVPFTVTDRPHDESLKMYYCWMNESSSNLWIGSSAKLSRDTIHLPLHAIPNNSVKLSVLYSVNVRQYALSNEGYEFLQRMKKNTEQVGSLFDAQPSELKGNIECAGDPTEIVIGYVEVSELQEKRIFVNRNEVLPWTFSMSCNEESVLNHPDSVAAFSYLEPTNPHVLSPFGSVIRYFGAPPLCVDCTLRGSNVKPSFWP